MALAKMGFPSDKTRKEQKQMDRLTAIIFLSAVAILTVLSCVTSEKTAATAPQAAPIVNEEKPSASGKEWDITLRKAQKEGKVSLVSSVLGQVPQALTESFKKKYNIDLEFVSGRGGEIATRILAQRKAGLYLTDVYLGGSTTLYTQIKPSGILEPLEPLFVLPELKDPETVRKTWWGGGFRWLDDQHVGLAMSTYVSPGLAINTKLVRPDEIKGYQDLLNPKWKEKIIFNDPTVAGSGGKQFGIVGSRIIGWEYWEKIAQQQPVIHRNERLLAEWLAQGKYAVLLGIREEIIREFVEAGAPLTYVSPVEGSYITSGTGVIAYLNNAPHPDGSRIFINWLLTQEGQSIFARANAVPSSRLDVSTEGLSPVLVLKPGQKYIMSDDEKASLEQPEHFERARKLFASLIR